MQPFVLRFGRNCCKCKIYFTNLNQTSICAHFARQTHAFDSAPVQNKHLQSVRDRIGRVGGGGGGVLRGLTLDMQRGQQYPYPRKHPHGCSCYPESAVRGGSITSEWDERGLTGSDGQQHQACNFCKSSSAREVVVGVGGSPVESCSLVLARLVGGL